MAASPPTSRTPTGGAISLVGLTKRFADATAVDAISLEIGAGEFFSLLGPSGCGKTTTLRMIAGFEAPTEGEILLDGQDLAGTAAHRRPVNTVFQSYALFPHLNVEDNIAYGLRWRRDVVKDDRARRVAQAVQLVRLGGLEQRKPAQLSGGQQQRVALARALVLEPRVLLLDEPLGALDAKLRKELQGELTNLQQQVGITFVYVTHDQEEALTMSDRLAVMHAGHIAQVGNPTEVYEEPATAFVADFLGVANLLDGRCLGPDGGGHRRVEIGSFTLLAAAGPSEAAAVKALIRPERVRVSAAAPSGGNCLPAMVERVVYVGATTQVLLRLPHGAPLAALVANHEGRPDWPAGTAVGVTLPAEAIRLLPT